MDSQSLPLDHPRHDSTGAVLGEPGAHAFCPGIAPEASVEASARSRWYLIGDSEVLVNSEGAVPTGEHPAIIAEEEPIYLGTLVGAPVWALGVDRAAELPEGLHWEKLQPMGLRLPEHEWALAGRAVQLVDWARTHRYCGRCSTPTEVVTTERSRRCPSCGLRVYPRIAPAMIVLVHRGQEVLLARGRAFPTAMYSALAGFVEPGESLEETVRREVFEEVGVQVGSISYFGSQPWPFPHSLMVGFNATWLAGDIDIDEEEIVDADWFDAGHLPMIPPAMSIARTLIDAWLAGVST